MCVVYDDCMHSGELVQPCNPSEIFSLPSPACHLLVSFPLAKDLRHHSCSLTLGTPPLSRDSGALTYSRPLQQVCHWLEILSVILGIWDFTEYIRSGLPECLKINAKQLKENSKRKIYWEILPRWPSGTRNPYRCLHTATYVHMCADRHAYT